MPTEAKIRVKYKKLHDDLSEAYYGGTRGLTKEEFDYQHGQIWANMEAELIAKGYLIPPEPPRDLQYEIDEIKARIEDINQLKADVAELKLTQGIE